MIIEDNFNDSAYDEDSYDYLFKGRKASPKREARQQKKQERKQNAPPKKGPVKKVAGFVRNSVNLVKAVPAAGKQLVRANFGMMDKDKNQASLRRRNQAPPPPLAIREEPEQTEEHVDGPLLTPGPHFEKGNEPPINHPTKEIPEETPESIEQPVAGDAEESSEETESEYDSDYDEDSHFIEPGTKEELKEVLGKKDGKAKDKPSTLAKVGAAFGWVCLGATVVIIGVVLFSSDEEPDKHIFKA